MLLDHRIRLLCIAEWGLTLPHMIEWRKSQNYLLCRHGSKLSASGFFESVFSRSRDVLTRQSVYFDHCLFIPVLDDLDLRFGVPGWIYADVGDVCSDSCLGRDL